MYDHFLGNKAPEIKVIDKILLFRFFYCNLSTSSIFYHDMHIPNNLVMKSIKLMKCCKAPGTSPIVTGMLKAFGDEGAQQISDIIEDIIHINKIPTEWEEGIIVSLCKGKEVALEQGITKASNCYTRPWSFLRCWETYSYDDNCASMTCSLASWLDAAPLTPYSLYASYQKIPMPSTRYCTWPLSILKRNSLV